MNKSAASRHDQIPEYSDVQPPSKKFGWVLGFVWIGVVAADAFAITFVIRPGTLTQPVSAPALAVCWFLGIVIGLLLGWAFDTLIAERSPRGGFWATLFWLTVAYYWLVRCPQQLIPF